MVYAGVVIYKDSKILLQLRDNNSRTENPLCGGIFGGEVKKDETPEQAATRELREELKLTTGKLKPLLKTDFKGERMHLFKMDLLKDISELELKEGKSMNLFSKQEILKVRNTVPGLKKLVKDFL